MADLITMKPRTANARSSRKGQLIRFERTPRRLADYYGAISSGASRSRVHRLLTHIEVPSHGG